MMDSQQIALVQDSWSKIIPHADATVTLFYEKLFELDPNLKSLFKNDSTQQRKKLLTTISLFVTKLNDLPALYETIEKLGERHQTYNVEDKHYDTFGIALLWTLKQSLGDAFSANEQRAWAIAYATLATVMKSATEQASKVA